uniref:ZZ-type domain-containing protein n=1 Tax=Mycena chlorophos TaxID=658473 RepID=A0ABQ0M2J8_MYCCL|nr:predicted protein [Mycena chlorophos]
MFTVKATYRHGSETRKFTFQSFPTYEELYSSLSRVFPLSDGASFSRLLFSPDASKGTVLIAREVNNKEQYLACTAAYAAKSTGLLRFTVIEAEAPMGLVTPASVNSFIPATLSSPDSNGAVKPQPHQADPQPHPAGQPCCAVNEAKLEMQAMVFKFKDDIDRILQSPALTPAPPAHIPLIPFMPPPPPPSSFCLFKYCTTCAKIFQGPWYICEKCSVVTCPPCHESGSGPQLCLTTMGPHIMKQEMCAACPKPEADVPPVSWAHIPPPPPLPQWVPPPMAPHYTPVYPFGAAAGAPITPVNAAATPVVPGPSASVVHRGIVCDVCEKVIEGVRHKCLDCPDYDLCTACIESGSAEQHNPFHEFLDIKEPGRVIVHNVYSGSGERDVPSANNTRAAPTSPSPVVGQQAVVHYATCNLCDSRIRGDRYKCQDCPDWDSCAVCFTITREQHPGHAFVKMSKPSDFIRSDRRTAPVHMATCNGCSKTIYGIRYKCLHPTCPDTDFCEDCEALPIPVHPDNHPLLKMRSPNTVIPTVYKVGQTTTIDRAEVPAPIPPPKPIQLVDPGFLVHPPPRSNTMPASFFDSAPPTPIRQPSPFFFKSESSRSVSPFDPAEYRTHPITVPYVPRPISPVMMPGGLYDEPAFTRQPRPYNAPPRSRFSHSPSPSPSPPLFNHPQRSTSPGPSSRPLTWAAPSWPRESWLKTLQLEDNLARQRKDAVDQLVEAHKSLEQHVEQQQQRWGAALEPAFWPKSSDELRHLMRSEFEPRAMEFSLSVPQEPAVMDSPLTNEALLNRPQETSQANKTPVTFQHSLAALLNGYESENEAHEPLVEQVPAPIPIPVALPEPTSVAAPIALGLRATFQDDLTLPDGQTFPPGAEFMKAWRMVNSGGEDWPASTELVWVAGERLARGQATPGVVHIGMVKVGAEVDLWTGELKAPEAPGRYVSYWRLRDGNGVLFGDNIWIDITVAETRSSDSSLSSSSIIMMPRGAQSVPTSSAPAISIAPSQASQVEVDENDSSDSDSDVSSVSLISMPVSEEDEDWASVPAGEEPQRYVVLYDETTSGSDVE